jgi:hypothetical protein
MAGEVGASISRILNKLQYALANNNSETSNIGALAAADRVPVADASADYALKYATPADIQNAIGNKVYLSLDIADGSAEAVYYLLSPVAGTISSIRSVIDGAVSTADITITAAIGATGVTNGVVTIATAASAAGDIDVATPTAANTIAANAAMNFTVTGGGSGGSPRIHLLVEITRT